MDDRKWHWLAAFLTAIVLLTEWLKIDRMTYTGCILIVVAIFFWINRRDIGGDSSE